MAPKKKVICPNCKAKLKFDPDKIVSDVVKCKCPSCSSILRLKKPVPQKETPPSSPTSQPADLLKKSGPEQPETVYSGPDSKPEINEDFRQDDHTDREREVQAPVTGKTEEDLSADSLSQAEDQDPFIPEDRDAPQKPTGESPLEDYHFENLKGFEKGEVGVSEPKAEQGVKQPETVHSSQNSESEVEKNFRQDDHTDRKREAETPVTEITEEDFSAAPKSPPEGQDPLIPEERTAPLKPPGESILDGYDHENLRGLGEGIAGPPEQKTDSSTEKPVTPYSGPDSKPEIKKDIEEGYHPDSRKEAETPVSEKSEEDFSAAPKPLPEGQGPLIPENRIVPLKPPGESILEDYDHENLQEYVEGEAEEGDFEWTRYADSKGPLIPESKIDLNVIPASDIGLHDTLADLQQSETCNLRGEHNLEKNRIKQAIRDFNHALDINPDYVDALVNRGSAYALQNRYNDALKDFNHALEIDRKQAGIYNLRGEIYLLNKMYDQATKDFTAAIILNPMYSDAFLNRARAYAERGMDEEADSDYNQAIKAASDKFSGFDNLETSESLFEEESASAKEKAAQCFQQGLEDLKSEKYYEAIENFTQAINLSSNDAAPYICRGQAFIELGQPDEAMVDLNRAAIYDPLNPVLYYYRATVWKALDSPINLIADLKLSWELGYEPACEEYHNLKPKKH